MKREGATGAAWKYYHAPLCKQNAMHLGEKNDLFILTSSGICSRMKDQAWCRWFFKGNYLHQVENQCGIQKSRIDLHWMQICSETQRARQNGCGTQYLRSMIKLHQKKLDQFCDSSQITQTHTISMYCFICLGSWVKKTTMKAFFMIWMPWTRKPWSMVQAVLFLFF